jgi:MFS family permease
LRAPSLLQSGGWGFGFSPGGSRAAVVKVGPMRTMAHPESRVEILALFTASMVAGSAAYAGMGALLPYVETAYAVSRAQVGFVAIAVVLGAAVTISASGVFCDRFGDRATLFWSGVVMAASLTAAALVHTYPLVLVFLFLYGIGFAGSTPAGSHAILFFFKKEERGLAMGIRQMGTPLGGITGALIFAAIGSRFGYQAAILAAAAVVLGVTSIATLLYREPPQLHGDRVAVRVLAVDVLHMAREPRLLTITLASVLLFFVQSAFIAYFPITMVHTGVFNAELAAVLFACGHLAAAFARVILGRASDALFRGSRAVPMAITAVIAAIGALGVSGAGWLPVPIIVVGALLLGFGGEGWFGLSLIAMAEIGGPEHAGGALGFGLTATFVSGAIAPLIVGVIASSAGYAVAWQVTAGVALAAAVPALLVARFLSSAKAQVPAAHS